jgi:hypothetical protein
MRQRNREEHQIVPPISGSPGGDADEQAEIRERGAARVAAADEAITRALSQDSTRFLAQNRQMGGE